MKVKKSQISIEYLIIIGFVTFILISILGVAFYYSGGIKDKIRVVQLNNFANKIISTSESVYYYGRPSKATISVYLPENVREITISENNLFITSQTSSGLEKTSFTSKVPIEGTLSINSGIKKIEIVAEEDKATIGLVS